MESHLKQIEALLVGLTEIQPLANHEFQPTPSQVLTLTYCFGVIYERYLGILQEAPTPQQPVVYGELGHVIIVRLVKEQGDEIVDEHVFHLCRHGYQLEDSLQ